MLKLKQSPEPLQPCAINHTYALQDFTGKTSQLPKPLQCQRPVCNYGYYCSRSNSHHQSSLCRDKFLVDERVFVVERTPGRRSVRLQHALDPSEFRQICLWICQLTSVQSSVSNTNLVDTNLVCRRPLANPQMPVPAN